MKLVGCNVGAVVAVIIVLGRNVEALNSCAVTQEIVLPGSCVS